MDNKFIISDFYRQFPDDKACLEKIMTIRFNDRIHCVKCKKPSPHYKLRSRPAYTCKFCRSQIYPLKNTIFEKSSTPIRIWFYAIYIMTQTRSGITIKNLGEELGVTYKTAWRMHAMIKDLMRQGNGDMLYSNQKIFKIVFLKKLELKIIDKQKPT